MYIAMIVFLRLMEAHKLEAVMVSEQDMINSEDQIPKSSSSEDVLYTSYFLWTVKNYKCKDSAATYSGDANSEKDESNVSLDKNTHTKSYSDAAENPIFCSSNSIEEKSGWSYEELETDATFLDKTSNDSDQAEREGFSKEKKTRHSPTWHFNEHTSILAKTENSCQFVQNDPQYDWNETIQSNCMAIAASECAEITRKFVESTGDSSQISSVHQPSSQKKNESRDYSSSSVSQMNISAHYTKSSTTWCAYAVYIFFVIVVITNTLMLILRKINHTKWDALLTVHALQVDEILGQ
ncbi:hypothetical protein ENBRE01_1263 [Enteropsectra breve]|nr:hypothetical protein ENBRE01_1263 [Enteropsectra breve]